MSDKRVKAWAVVSHSGEIGECRDYALEIYYDEGIAKAMCLESDGERVVRVTIIVEAG